MVMIYKPFIKSNKMRQTVYVFSFFIYTVILTGFLDYSSLIFGKWGSPGSIDAVYHVYTFHIMVVYIKD